MKSWLAILLALCAPLGAFAQTQGPVRDWIDEFPSVEEVAHGAFEEMKVTAQRNNFDNTGDDDAIAINLVGTFVVLKQIMLLKVNEEPSMSRERQDRLRKQVAAYSEAELTVGRGWAGRRGYITRGPPTGMSCSDEACYRRWFLLHLHGSSGRAEYRERVLKRLFPCGTLAQELNDLRQRHATTVPYMPSPATTLRIDREIVGIGPAGCAAYGGDARQTGLCDSWRVPAAASAAAAGPASAAKAGTYRQSSAGCRIIELKKVRIAKTGGLRVSIAPTSAKAGDVVAFRVSRSASDVADGSPAFWDRPATITAGSTDLEAVVATGPPLVTDPARPFLVVDTSSVRSRGPTQCEQPTTGWQKHHEKPQPKGLHGPYASVDEAVVNDHASLLALQLTATSGAEQGFVIVKRSARAEYFATPPLASSSGAANQHAQPQFQARDYQTSHDRAFDGSCENEDEFGVAAIVHTHPLRPNAPDMFSADDFQQAITLERLTHDPTCASAPDALSKWFCAKARRFELTVMVNLADKRVRSFRPCPGDTGFVPLVDWVPNVALTLGNTDMAPLVPTWRGYRDRSDILTRGTRSRAC